jgi:hypothetical protein
MQRRRLGCLTNSYSNYPSYGYRLANTGQHITTQPRRKDAVSSSAPELPETSWACLLPGQKRTRMNNGGISTTVWHPSGPHQSLGTASSKRGFGANSADYPTSTRRNSNSVPWLSWPIKILPQGRSSSRGRRWHSRSGPWRCSKSMREVVTVRAFIA